MKPQLGITVARSVLFLFLAGLPAEFLEKFKA